MKQDDETIGTRLKLARNSKNLTIPQVSQKTGISKGNLSVIENDKTKPSADALILLSDLYGVSVDWILKGETNKGNGILNNFSPTFTVKEFQSFMKEIEEAWEKGDAETRGWVVVQLRKAFPEMAQKLKKKS